MGLTTRVCSASCALYTVRASLSNQVVLSLLFAVCIRCRYELLILNINVQDYLGVSFDA